MLRVNEEDLSDVILLSAVNVKRNYADLAFPPKLDDEGRKEAQARAKQALFDAFPGLVPVQTELNDETPDSFESMMEDLAFFAEDAPKLWDVWKRRRTAFPLMKPQTARRPSGTRLSAGSKWKAGPLL